jgi:hypothetical protein
MGPLAPYESSGIIPIFFVFFTQISRNKPGFFKIFPGPEAIRSARYPWRRGYDQFHIGTFLPKIKFSPGSLRILNDTAPHPAPILQGAKHRTDSPANTKGPPLRCIEGPKSFREHVYSGSEAFASRFRIFMILGAKIPRGPADICELGPGRAHPDLWQNCRILRGPGSRPRRSRCRGCQENLRAEAPGTGSAENRKPTGNPPEAELEAPAEKTGSVEID